MDSRDLEIEALEAQVKELQKTIKKNGYTTSEAAEEAAEQSAKERFKMASEKMKESLDTTKETLKQKGEKADKFAKENPWHVAAIAAAAGIILASITSGKKR